MEVINEVKVKNKTFMTYIKEYIEKNKKQIISSISAFLVARIIIFGGLSPFSMPFVLASGGNVFVLIMSLLGIISNLSLNSYKYILINLFGMSLNTLIKWVMPKIKREKREGFVSFTSSFIFSLIFILFKEYVAYDVLLILFESTLSFFSYFVIKKGIDGFTGIYQKSFFTVEESITTLVILTFVIAGIGNINLPLNISLKNIICISLVLMSINKGNVGQTAQIASFMGIAAGCGTDFMGNFVATYAVNSLLASCFSKYGKIASVLGFVLGNVAMSLVGQEEYFSVIGYFDIVLASGIFFAMPDKFFTKIFTAFNGGMSDYERATTVKEIASIKLNRLGIAFKKLSDMILSTVLKPSKNSIYTVGTLVDAVGDKVCKKCALRFYCWQKDYDITLDAITKAIKELEKEGNITTMSLPEYFRKKCNKQEEIINAVTSLYEIYRLNFVWQKRFRDNTRLYKEQFKELSDIVFDLKGEIEKNPYFDKDLSAELSSELEKEGYGIKNASVIKDCNENISVELIMYPCNRKEKCYDFLEERLKEILGIPFYKVSGKCSAKECKLLYKEQESYFIDTKVKTKVKEGSEKSGDNYAFKTLENSSRYIALCDGSGSGREASICSLNTLKLLEEFLKTGFSKSASVKLINSSLICNSESDYFSTVDLSITDLKTGDTEIIKRGACPTFIKHANGEYSVIRNDDLPLGVTKRFSNVIKKVKLRENDIFVMVSDGVCDALSKDDWIIDALKAIPSDDIEVISDTILKIAESTKKGNMDDMTVIVSTLKPASIK